MLISLIICLIEQIVDGIKYRRSLKAVPVTVKPPKTEAQIKRDMYRSGWTGKYNDIW